MGRSVLRSTCLARGGPDASASGLPVFVGLCQRDRGWRGPVTPTVTGGVRGWGTSKNMCFSLKCSRLGSEWWVVVLSVLYSFTQHPPTEYRLSFVFAIFQGNTHKALFGGVDTDM